MTALSPTFLPSVNLMIDIPAISLGLAAIVIFFRAIDASKTNYLLIVLCGLIAGVAAQTKYNAALASAAILWAGILYRRRLPALLVVSLGAAVFIGWEMYLTGIYGRSHFLLALEIRRIKPVSLPPHVSPFERIFREVLAFAGYKAHLAAPLIGNLGGLLPALALLAGVALRVPSRWIYRGMAFVVIGFVLMAIVPEEWSVFSRDGKDGEEITLRSVFVACTGSMVVVALVCVSGYLGFRGWRRSRPRLRRDRAAWFLIGWALLEIAGYFVLSPFPAARRLMGFVVVATLLTGRLLARTCRSAHRRLPAQVTIVFGVVLGIFFATVDFMDAFPEIRAPAAAVAWIRQQPGGDHRIWFAGHWGFQYAAERAGAEPIFPEAFDPKPGDWLILPIGERPDSQKVYLSETDADLRLVMEWRINLGLRTIPDFYCGHTPMRHQEGPRVAVKVYQWK